MTCRRRAIPARQRARCGVVRHVARRVRAARNADRSTCWLNSVLCWGAGHATRRARAPAGMSGAPCDEAAAGSARLGRACTRTCMHAHAHTWPRAPRARIAPPHPTFLLAPPPAPPCAAVPRADDTLTARLRCLRTGLGGGLRNARTGRCPHVQDGLHNTQSSAHTARARARQPLPGSLRACRLGPLAPTCSTRCHPSLLSPRRST